MAREKKTKVDLIRCKVDFVTGMIYFEGLLKPKIMLTFELLLQKFSLFGFIYFLFVLLMGLYRLKRMSKLPLIVFLFILLTIPGIIGLLWLFAAFEVAVWGWWVTRRLN